MFVMTCVKQFTIAYLILFENISICHRNMNKKINELLTIILASNHIPFQSLTLTEAKDNHL